MICLKNWCVECDRSDQDNYNDGTTCPRCRRNGENKMHTKYYVIVRPELVTQGLSVPVALHSMEHDPHVHYYNPAKDKNHPKPSRYLGDDLQVLFGKRWRFVCGTDWDFLTDEEAQRLVVEPGLNQAGRHFMGYR